MNNWIVILKASVIIKESLVQADFTSILAITLKSPLKVRICLPSRQKNLQWGKQFLMENSTEHVPWIALTKRSSLVVYFTFKYILMWFRQVWTYGSLRFYDSMTLYKILAAGQILPEHLLLYRKSKLHSSFISTLTWWMTLVDDFFSSCIKQEWEFLGPPGTIPTPEIEDGGGWYI